MTAVDPLAARPHRPRLPADKLSCVTDATKSSGRTQRERVEESSRRLVEPAIELIAEKGFTNTTAQEIGIRAGYSRAMVHERYGSKEALLETILADYEGRIDVAPEPGASGCRCCARCSA